MNFSSKYHKPAVKKLQLRNEVTKTDAIMLMFEFTELNNDNAEGWFHWF